MEPVRWPPRVRGVGGSRQMRVSCNPLWKNNLYGAIAQLGERLPCKQEVEGSTPFGSTICAGSLSEKRLSRQGMWVGNPPGAT